MSVDVRRDPPDYFQYEEHGRRWPFVLLIAAVGFLVLAGAGVIWVQRQINPPGAVGEQVRVTVQPGMSTSDIAALLEREGIIVSKDIFKYYAKLTGLGTIEAGDYTVEKKADLSAVKKVLEGGAAKAADDRVTIPEGLTLPKIAQLVQEQLPGRSAAKFLEVAKNGTVRSQYQTPGATSVEGFILPETYFVAKTDDETAVLKKMVDAFDQLATKYDVTGAAAKLKITPYQVIIVASIVEREALIDDDRGKVARVIYNRLAGQMQLQMDSTVLYAIGKEGKSNVTLDDRKINSPYNTFIAPGLPPGPISQPGPKSLQGAAAPSPGDWLYFVTTDVSGRSSFTANYNQFLKDVAVCEAKGLC